MRLRRVRRGIVSRVRMEARTKNYGRKIGAMMGTLGVMIIGVYMTTKGWIHCRRVGIYGGFRGDGGRNYR